MRSFAKLCILTAILFAEIAHGATVSWNAFQDTGVILQGVPASAPALANGNWVQIGYFKTLSNAQVSVDSLTLSGANSTATLASDFFLFASLQLSASGSTTNSGLGAAGPGGWQQLTTNFLYSNNPTFQAGHQIYLWALNSANNSSLALAEQTVTQQAIVSLPTWSFPASDISGQVNIDIANLSSVNRQMLAGTYVPLANNSNLSTAGFGTPNNAVQLASVAAVPEPSTFTFGALAALVAAASRKRLRK